MDINFTKQLGEFVKNETASGSKMKMVNRDDFSEHLGILITRINNFASLISNVSATGRALVEKIYAASGNKNNVACNLYMDIAKKLGKNDTTIPFGSVSAVANNLVELLESINRMVTELFAEKSITIYNTKLSHMAVFGILSESEFFVNYGSFLLDAITSEICTHNNMSELPSPKKYRSLFIVDNESTFIEICKTRLAIHSQNFTSDFVRVRSVLDVNIVDQNNNFNSAFMDNLSIPASIKNSVFNGSKGLAFNPFNWIRWLGEQWMLLKHAKYLRAKKEKEWLEAHAALLKLELQGVDPNSDEYRKLVKIIEAYNEQIAELDQKISKYENGN